MSWKEDRLHDLQVFQDQWHLLFGAWEYFKSCLVSYPEAQEKARQVAYDLVSVKVAMLDCQEEIEKLEDEESCSPTPPEPAAP